MHVHQPTSTSTRKFDSVTCHLRDPFVTTCHTEPYHPFPSQRDVIFEWLLNGYVLRTRLETRLEKLSISSIVCNRILWRNPVDNVSSQVWSTPHLFTFLCLYFSRV